MTRKLYKFVQEISISTGGVRIGVIRKLRLDRTRHDLKQIVDMHVILGRNFEKGQVVTLGEFLRFFRGNGALFLVDLVT